MPGLPRAASLLVLAIACEAPERPPVGTAPTEKPQASASRSEGSVRAIVAAYEDGSLTLASATERLADLIEPMNGFAVSSGQSAGATELFDAVGRELKRRNARRYELSDSIR